MQLIKNLKDWSLNLSKVPELLDDAADTIEELTEKIRSLKRERSIMADFGGWIPVEERLPEINASGRQSDIVLIALRWYDGEITTEVGWYNSYGNWSEDSDNRKVIAWQPLPPAYEPKED